jgi:hypothetical protein
LVVACFVFAGSPFGFRLLFAFPLASLAASFSACFALAALRSSNVITLALLRIADLVDRRVLASLFILVRK